MPEFVATLARTVYTPVRFEAANEAEAAKMAETMRIAFEHIEPCDVAVTKDPDRPGLRGLSRRPARDRSRTAVAVRRT
jgi:hypothetical protein